ncbi:uncharacterized protein LOC118512363 [Anopheles stephensi]|uniref:uncharacterized protein LOC118512363 n=1 Tax=Anopheles stephensi TaxID=30069 RepID=UPI0016587839|nr:uncharacterized protein LOC118512363 [Anopheles stephensi]
MEEEQRRLSQQFETPGTALLQPGYGQPLPPNAPAVEQQGSQASSAHFSPSLSSAPTSLHPPSLAPAASMQHPPSLPGVSQNGEPTMYQIMQLLRQLMTKIEQQPPASLPTNASQQQLPVVHPPSASQQQPLVSEIASQPQQQHRSAPANPEQILDSLARNITEFRFEAEAGLTFEAWYSRYEEHAEITLEQLSAECSRLVALKKQNAMIIGEKEERVLAIQNGARRSHHGFRGKGLRSRPIHRDDRSGKPSNPCWFCGALHWVKDCPHTNHKCRECGEVGHLEERCRKQKHRAGRKFYRPTRFAKTVTVCSVRASRKFVEVSINGVGIRLQLDTGSDISVIGRSAWEKVGKPSLVQPTVCAKTASNERLELLGEFRAEVAICNATKPAIIRVAQVDLLLLGADLIDLFALSSVPMDVFCAKVSTTAQIPKELQSRFPEVFRGTGLCTKAQIKLQLKDNCRPVFRPKRPVAYAMQATVEEELDRLVQMNVITPVDYSEWATPIVVVRKSSGAIRICGDYSTGLNDALRPHEYPLPLPDDIFARLAHCKFFSKVDLSDAFLQVEIEERYRPLLTINTHRGLYLYNRLPPGLKVASAAFQQIMDAMLAGLCYTSGYLDDVVVGGRTEEEHDENLNKVLQRIKEFGFTIKAEKCAFKTHQIEYLGHIIDRTGLRPNPKKIDAIVNLPAPSNVNEVRSFLGAINYYGKFVPNMRNLRYPLDNLLKDGNQFVWTKQCGEAFRKFKEILKSDLLLTHYDPTAEIIVAADASSVGLGATISHKFPDGSIKVVQHASRALTKAEEGYSQIDREGLAIIFAVTRFHKMLYGRHFRLQTDHKPLLRIFGSKKGIPVYTANRLQRFALALQLYDFEIEYIPTDKFGNADLLSRLISKHAKPEQEYMIRSCSSYEKGPSTARSVPLRPIGLARQGQLWCGIGPIPQQKGSTDDRWRLYPLRREDCDSRSFAAEMP